MKPIMTRHAMQQLIALYVVGSLVFGVVLNPNVRQTTASTSTVSSAFVTGFDTSVPTSGLPMPALNVPYIDEWYGTKITRVTDATQASDSHPPDWVRHEYSRRPAFNADSTKALMVSSNGWLRLYAVNAASNTMRFVSTFSVPGPIEPNWDPIDPDIFYYLGRNRAELKIYFYDTSSGVTGVARDLTQQVADLYPEASGAWTNGEGRPSIDNSTWCLQVETADHRILGLISYNFDSNQVTGHLDLPDGDRPNSISASPLGDYCVPMWNSDRGIRAYNLEFSNYTQLHPTADHSDLAITSAGQEVLVYGDFVNGIIAMTALDTGEKTTLFAIFGPDKSSTAMHVSGIATDRPGYAVISFYFCSEERDTEPCDPTRQWFDSKVIITQLKAEPTIYNVAHSHYRDAGYWSETHAVTNRDLSKILFATSWESSDESTIASYMIDIPADALP